MFNNCSSLQTINLDLTDYGDGSSSNGYVYSANNMFSGCSKLRDVTLTNTSGLLSTSSMFNGCTSLTTIPLFDTSNVTNMNQMFDQCSKITEIPQFNTSNVVSLVGTFNRCVALQTVPLLDASKVENVSQMFGSTNNFFAKAVTTLGGFTNLGKAFTGTSSSQHTLSFQYNVGLTKQSIMNVINNLAAPDDTTCTDATLKLSAASYALLDASDIAIATAKN